MIYLEINISEIVIIFTINIIDKNGMNFSFVLNVCFFILQKLKFISLTKLALKKFIEIFVFEKNGFSF